MGKKKKKSKTQSAKMEKEEIEEDDSMGEAEEFINPFQNFHLESLTIVARNGEDDKKAALRLRDASYNEQRSQSERMVYGSEVNRDEFIVSELSKESTVSELRQKCLDHLNWPPDQLRLWHADPYIDYLLGSTGYDLPAPLEEPDKLLFPSCCTGMRLVAEKTVPPNLRYPSSSSPITFSEDSYPFCGSEHNSRGHLRFSVFIPAINRNQLSNSLFASLGYLFDEPYERSSGTISLDEEQPPLLPSTSAAAHIRKTLSRFALKNSRVIDERSGILRSEPLNCSAKEYSLKVLSVDYPGCDVDLWVAALRFGCVFQVFDVERRCVREYGRGCVEKYGHPDRLGPRGLAKLVRWKDGEFNPLVFVNEQGCWPERIEEPFSSKFTVQAFEWLGSTNPDLLSPVRECASSKCNARGLDLSVCGHCHSAYYCSRRCQKKHWKSSHKGFCARHTHVHSRQGEQKELEEKRDFFLQLKGLQPKDGREKLEDAISNLNSQRCWLRMESGGLEGGAELLDQVTALHTLYSDYLSAMTRPEEKAALEVNGVASED